jgi:anaerobic selenocysteine-containing dehydrogenase
MALELVSCQGCGEPFISQRTLDSVLEIVKEKGRNNHGDFFLLCQRCRAHRFAEHLVGNRLEKVEGVRYIPKRRQEKLCPVKGDDRLGTTVYKTECFICNQGCDALVHVKHGEVVRVQGDPSSSVTKGTLCSKGLASRELLYHPDRLLYPLKRTGERGQGRWQRISWDEALDTITRRFNEIEEQYGEHSIVLASGTNRGWISYFLRFANAYGKQRIGPGVAQCFMPRSLSEYLSTP